MTLLRHAFVLACAYGAAAIASAVTVWAMMVVLSTIEWAGRMLGIDAVEGWGPTDTDPILAIASGLFVVPLGTMAAAMFLPPVMLVAYPVAVVVAHRVAAHRRVAMIGAGLAAALAPVILALRWHWSEQPAYRTGFWQVYTQSLPVTLLPSIVAGATIGWLVARLQGRSAVSVGAVG